MSTSITLTEQPDRILLQKIARHREVYDEDRDRLEAFSRMVHDDGIEITYEQKMTTDKIAFGRLYPQPYRLNATYQWGRVRSTLYSATETDIDIVNCQPSVLLGYCNKLKQQDKMNEGDYDSLVKWIENRDEIIEAFHISDEAISRYNKKNDDTKTKKDIVKNLVIVTSFGGTVNQWAKSFDLDKDDYKVDNWYRFYEMESTFIAKTVVENHPKKDIAIKMWRDSESKKAYKKNAPPQEEIAYKKVLSLILQDKEAEIVVKAIKKLQRKGIEVTSYIYDGFQVKNTDLLTDEVLEEIGCPEFNCRFIRKPFARPLPMEDTHLLQEPPDFFRPSIFSAFGKTCENIPTSEITLQEKKKYFETYFAKLEGCGKIMERNGDKIYYHGASNFKIRFGNLIYFKKTDFGVTKDNFYNWWLEQVDCLSYRSVEVCPPPLKVPSNVLNLWDGWPIEKVELDTSVSFQPIIDLFDIATNHDVAAREYLLQWFALKVQRPGSKTLVSPVFYTHEEGTGKTLISEKIFKAFLGDMWKNLSMSASNIDSVLGKFSTAAENLICVLNEAECGDIIGKSNPLKSFITDETASKEVKGVMSVQINNICELIFTTNNANALKIGQHDRRFVVFEADKSVANNRVVFGPIIKSINDEKVMRHFFEYLNTMDISGFCASEMRPKTKIYKEMRAASLSTIQNFFIDLYDNMKGNEVILSGVLYNKYSEYGVRIGKGGNKVGDRKFISTAKREVKGLTSVKKYFDKVQSRCIDIDYEVLGNWVYEMRGEVNDDEILDYEGQESEEECQDI